MFRARKYSGSGHNLLQKNFCACTQTPGMDNAADPANELNENTGPGAMLALRHNLKEILQGLSIVSGCILNKLGGKAWA